MWENCRLCSDLAWESASNHCEKGVPRLMEVSIFAAFVAGLVSFLSPCVLPLVPGYISMLSGIGVEQLKEGNAPRGGLLLSAVAFVLGFSIVFISFGASASAVGTFLVRNRSLLAPLAGSLIVLFGLHLVGWLAKITIPSMMGAPSPGGTHARTCVHRPPTAVARH